MGIRPLETLLHNLGRETFLAPITWDENGWPVVGNDGNIELEMDGPLPGEVLPLKNVWRDDFDKELLDVNWNFVRNPEKDKYDLSSRKGWIQISGGKETLSEAEGSPAFIGIRQQHFFCTVSTKISFEPEGEGSEAGITAYYNDSYHYEVFLTKSNGEHYIGLRKKLHDVETVTNYEKIEYHGDIELRIKADRQYYRFEYELPGGGWRQIGKGMAAGLCTKGTHTMTFTGVYMGIYCVNGNAYFDRFEYAV